MQTSLNTFDQLCKITINWVHIVAFIEPYWVYLGSFGSDSGPFLDHFLRAKNYVIFSAKKLGLERPMFDSCWAMCFSETAFCANYVHKLIKTTRQAHIIQISVAIGSKSLCRLKFVLKSCQPLGRHTPSRL